MIICFYQEQAEVLHQQKWIQVDMAFKRLKDPTYREIVFAMMNEVNKKSEQTPF
jgi:hypothetical protein